MASIYGKGTRKHVRTRCLRYKLVPAPNGRKIIGSIWVFKVKPGGRFQSRLCAQGFSQVAGTDVGSNTLQSTPSKLPALCWPLLPATIVMQLDVQIAFPQSEMKEEIYVKQPVRFEKLDQNGQPYVCKLKKSLCGLKQSTRNWHGTIQHELITEGFNGLHVGPMCLRQG